MKGMYAHIVHFWLAKTPSYYFFLAMQFCCFSLFMIKITVVITSLITDGEGVEAVTSLKYRRTGRISYQK